jgi:hypothetical protein
MTNFSATENPPCGIVNIGVCESEMVGGPYFEELKRVSDWLSIGHGGQLCEQAPEWAGRVLQRAGPVTTRGSSLG